MFFRKPKGMWAALERLEYLVPEALPLPTQASSRKAGSGAHTLAGFPSGNLLHTPRRRNGVR